MARKRKPSDDLYNARRRVRRLADRVERLGDVRMAEGLRYLADVGRGVTIESLNSAYVAGKAQYDRPSKAAVPKPSKAAVPKPSKASVPKTAEQVEIGFDSTLPTVAAKQPRKRKPSDEVYNARRRLRRQAERIERDSQGLQGVAKEQARGFAKYLREQAGKGLGERLTEVQRGDLLDRLASIRSATRAATYEPYRIRRRNLIFTQQLNAAGTKDADSSIGEREKDVFWAATKGLWTSADVPRNQRYDKILDYFYNLSGNASTTAKDFQEWLEREKGLDVRDVYGDLQYVFEYVTSELNDPADYESPDTPYGTWINRILFVR